MNCCRFCGIASISGCDWLHTLADHRVQQFVSKFCIRLAHGERLSEQCCNGCFGKFEAFELFLAQIGEVQATLEKSASIGRGQSLASAAVSAAGGGRLNVATLRTYSRRRAVTQPIDRRLDGSSANDLDTGAEGTRAAEGSHTVPRSAGPNQAPPEVAFQPNAQRTPSYCKDIVALYYEQELKAGTAAHAKTLVDGIGARDLNEDGSFRRSPAAFKWTNYRWACSETNCHSAEFGTAKELTAHYKSTHATTPPLFKCPQCPRTFKMLATCTNHIFEHEPSARFCCPLCSVHFNEILQLYVHQKWAHQHAAKICLYCGKHFFKSSDMREHRLAYHVREPTLFFTCDICSKQFRSKDILKNHLQIHQSTRPHVCEVCGKDFPKKQYLDTHQLVHGTVSKHKCAVCAKAFKTSSNLTRHATVHKSVKDVVCTQCDKKFASRFALKIHMKVHSADKPYRCEFCDKQFKHCGVFKDHRRIHTGERPYACSQCPSNFSGYPNYSKHMKIHGIDVKKTKV